MTMVHVLTVHYKTAMWIDLQLDSLARHMRVPYRTYGCIEGIDEAAAARFDRVVHAFGEHAGKLNYMAAMVCNDAPGDDLLMFLDGDAFPITDPMPTIERALSSSDLVAVRRDENMGDRQPHPCFAVTKVSTWKSLHGDWSQGFPWETAARGRLVSDVGGNLLYLLEADSRKWTPLNRTNTRNIHPLFFGVYGDIVYHHGAGFRVKSARVDRSQKRVGTLLGRVRRLWRMRKLQALSDSVVARIRQDPHFYRELCGVELG